MSSVRLSLSVSMLLCALACGVSAQTQPATPATDRRHVSARNSTPSASVLRDMDSAMDEVAGRVLPAVVQIAVSGFGQSRQGGESGNVIERQRGIGSGVIVDSDGYVITNAHVVSGAQRIQVVMRSLTTELVPGQTSLAYRQRTFAARLVGTHRLTDLALLKIEGKDLPYIPLKEEYKVRLGQTVLAVGSPQGLDHTVTKGIVSALGRQQDIDHPMIYVQTDAPINPGNSGGALVDRDGNLVGINTFIYSRGGGSEGLGFAIPGPTVRFVYQELKAHGRVRQTVIAANAQTITSTLAAALKLSQDWGVIISDVIGDGPAEKAGLKPRDIVVAVDDRPIDSLPKFAAALFLHQHDRVVQMDVLRGGEKLRLAIPAIESHAGDQNLEDLIDPQKGLIASLGIFGVELNASIAALVPNLRSASGVIVTGKVDYLPAVDADLVPGDVIHAINGLQLTGLDHLRAELERLKTGAPVALEVERQGRYLFVSFEKE